MDSNEVAKKFWKNIDIDTLVAYRNKFLYKNCKVFFFKN